MRLHRASALLALSALGARAVDNGYTTAVTWDAFSLSVQGQRIFLQGGEFHPWRLPSRSLWRDVFTKMAAGGLNSVSIYSMPGMQNPAPGVIDFEGLRDMEFAYKEAQRAGLLVVARPGPYVNAEVTGGGLPSWLLTLEGTPRTNATTFTEAWKPYWTEFAKIIARNQITNGGPVVLTQVENEFDNGATRAAYMQLLQDVLRENGVVIPTTHNNKGLRAITYATGAGKVDIWGIDSYPGNGCNAGWADVVTNYNEFKNSSGALELPLYSPEFVGGWFDPWGSTSNYQTCRATKQGADFVRLFYQSLWAQNARLQNIYMYYGGTNWGGIAAPVVYTSYDYAAAIQENRVLTEKYNEVKLMALFLRSAKDFRQTTFAPEVTTLTSTDQVAVAELTNYQAESTFYIARHNKSSSTVTVPFKLNAKTSQGLLTIPQLNDAQVVLLSRDSRVIVADYKFGTTHVLYSTPSVLLSTTIDKVDWLVVYGKVGADSSFELALVGPKTCSASAGDFDITTQTTEYGVIASFALTEGRAVVTCGTTKILALDLRTARTFWSPVLAGRGSNGQTPEIGSNSTIIVSGPTLVRSATLIGPLLTLTGDTNSSVPLRVYGLTTPLPIITWNGLPVIAKKDALGAWSATLPGPSNSALKFAPPALSQWKYKNSLPEIAADYDDSRWLVANKTSSYLTFPAYARDGPALLGEQDYGFPIGNILWRGHFTAEGTETGVSIGVNGGQAFAAVVYLNSVYLGSLTSTTSTDTDVKNGTFTFPEGALVAGEDNVVTVLKDNMGINQNSGPGGLRQARGIVGYELIGGAKFSSWKVQGNLGGETAYPDKVRGLLNEGGLYGERAGWHLPGFSDASWESRTPFQGLTAPGVGFFRTTFDLNVPLGHDVALSFVFSGGASTRVMLFVNGWQMGRYHANIGPQKVFPVHEGVLNYHGKNTVALSLWSVGDKIEDFSISSLELKVDSVVRGGVGLVQSTNPSYTKRDVY